MRKDDLYKKGNNTFHENNVTNRNAKDTEFLRFACLNVRGWSFGKLEDICKECEEWNIDFIGITETQLRERVSENNNGFNMENKGRSKWLKKGGGVGYIYKDNKINILEEIDVGSDMKHEDVLALLIEYNKFDKYLIIVSYMTVEGPEAKDDNTKKFNCIKNIIERYPKQKIILMGDMNAHIGILGEKINNNGKRLLDFAENQNLEILNSTIARGKVTWTSGNSKSAIDYVLTNSNARDFIDSMWIDEEGNVDITTDHNLIMIDVKSKIVKKTMNKCRTSWKIRDANWHNYRSALNRFDILEDECFEIDSMEQNMKNKITSTANNIIGKTRGTQKQNATKSWCTPEIVRERQKRRKFNRKCKELRKQGYNVQPDKELYITAWNEYRKQQIYVKKIIQKAIASEEQVILKELQENGEIGGKKWYRYLRGEKTISEEITEIICEGEIITDPDQIKASIQKYWEDIGECSNKNTNEIDMKIGTTEMQDFNLIFSKEKIKKCLNKLKDNKAPGLDSLPYEMYKYGGGWIVDSLYNIFDKIIEEEKVPVNWNKCKVKLIHKGGNKNKKDLKNYRPISLINTISKIFCSLLNDSIVQNIEENDVLGEEQQGFRRERRGEDNLFILNETIENHRKENKDLYICYIDIEKAYDKVDREVLFKVLEKVGLPVKVINIIRSLYRDTKALYSLGEFETDWVDIKNGVRQGCVLSPTLFNLYTEELAVRIKQSNMGVRIGEDKLGLLMYADDMVILAESTGELQNILEIVESYGKDYNIKYSTDKTQVMTISSVQNTEIAVSLAGNRVKNTDKYKYLGLNITKNGATNIKTDKLFKARQWLGRLASMAKFRSNKYEMIRGLWKTAGVPAVMYGAGVISWTKEELNKLETIQNDIGRVALGATRIVGAESIRGEVGWSTFEERIMKSSVIYKKRIENMKDGRIVKKIYNLYTNKSKWQRSCSQYVKLCGFRKMFVISLDGNIQPGYKIINENGLGIDWTYSMWKNTINKKVEEIGLKKWKEGISKKETLIWYNYKKVPKHEFFYSGDLGSSLLFKCRTNSLEVNFRTYRWNESRSKLCSRCNLNLEETIRHLITECSYYEEEREFFINKAMEILGRDRWNELSRTEGDDDLQYIFGLQEMPDMKIIKETKILLTNIWRKRNMSEIT